MNDRLINKLYELRDTNPTEVLHQVSELGDSLDERIIAAVLLIDCGDALGDSVAISRGVDILNNMLSEIGFDPTLAYNLANGLQLRARLSSGQESSFLGQAADDRFQARVMFGRVMNDPTASIDITSQMSTNIGILFLETYRWVEAIDCFQHAQRLLPINAVAAFQEMRRLMALADLFSREPETYQSYCHIDTLIQRFRHLADIVSNNYDVVEKYAGNAALPIVQRAVEHAKRFDKFTEESVENPYFSYIQENNLALSLHCSSDELSSGRFDLLTIPHIGTTVEDGRCVPEIFAMMNVMKADFAFARQVFFDVREYDFDTPFFETTSHSDTLDYAVYGVRYSALATAQRIAFDILDKIAVALACYLKIPNASRTSFTKIWGKNVKGRGFVFSKQIEAELARNNQPLIALFNIFQDISKHGNLGEDFMGAQKQYRNASTHRFTVLHDMGNMWKKSSSIEHKRLSDFERLTLSSLRLTRAALFYFVDFIVVAERHKEERKGGIIISSHVPDHDYIRGRQGSSQRTKNAKKDKHDG